MIEIRHKITNAILLTLDRANLTGADLARANLTGADLARANLTGADLARANLADANLAGAYLAGANLADANLDRANLADAYLARANLAGAYLAGAYLAGADLTDANLTGADLTDAYLAGANLARTTAIDGGQDARGFRFWAWRRADGPVIFRGGCREWVGADEARAHYGEEYTSDGARAECLARIELMAAVAKERGWL